MCLYTVFEMSGVPMNHTQNRISDYKELPSYLPLPLFEDRQQGYFSFNKKMDLNLYCIKKPQNTCFIRVTNPNMLAWGIELNDMLVVEKNDSLSLGDIVVLEKEHEFLLYEFMSHQNGEFIFLSLDSNLKNIRVSDWRQLSIIGTVTNTIHQMKPKNNLKFAA